MTQIERFPITLRRLEVLAIEDIAPRLRRITLGGAELGAFTGPSGPLPALQSIGPDDHVKLFFPDPASGQLALPLQGAGRLHWPEDPPAISREYTPRAFDPASGALLLDFVLHDHGIATTWAATVRVGDHIHIAGPKASMHIPDCPAAILLGDETAIPAMANWIEMRPAGQAVTIFAFSDDPAMQPMLVASAGVSLHWLPQMPESVAAWASLLAPFFTSAGAPFLWAAGERAAISALRGWITQSGLDPAQCDLSNYWTRGAAAED